MLSDRTWIYTWYAKTLATDHLPTYMHVEAAKDS